MSFVFPDLPSWLLGELPAHEFSAHTRAVVQDGDLLFGVADDALFPPDSKDTGAARAGPWGTGDPLASSSAEYLGVGDPHQAALGVGPSAPLFAPGAPGSSWPSEGPTSIGLPLVPGMSMAESCAAARAGDTAPGMLAGMEQVMSMYDDRAPDGTPAALYRTYSDASVDSAPVSHSLLPNSLLDSTKFSPGATPRMGVPSFSPLSNKGRDDHFRRPTHPAPSTAYPAPIPFPFPARGAAASLETQGALPAPELPHLQPTAARASSSAHAPQYPLRTPAPPSHPGGVSSELRAPMPAAASWDVRRVHGLPGRAGPRMSQTYSKARPFARVERDTHEAQWLAIAADMPDSSDDALRRPLHADDVMEGGSCTSGTFSPPGEMNT
ncbi:hypothetical protein MSPP1_001311 [Malassezia sp. CBS 17886]|nr:hypothetical protein MSPP1_001311 [Malassezia sp. CBS 17886]